MADELLADAGAAVESPVFVNRETSHSSGSSPSGSTSGGNGDYPWDSFDSDAYFSHNYRALRDDDRQILSGVRDHFSGVTLRPGAVGIDVGPGANLYPALSMLPLCGKIVLWERSNRNIAWLRGQLRRHGSSWDEFWTLLAEKEPYRALDDPWKRLSQCVEIKQGSIFELPRDTFDIGTMFFVAESISTWPRQFEEAVSSFVRSLRPGAPFAAAFMCGSKGYYVGDIFFPAVPVSISEIHRCVARIARVDPPLKIGKGDNPLRDDYDGMALVTGWRK